MDSSRIHACRGQRVQLSTDVYIKAYALESLATNHSNNQLPSLCLFFLPISKIQRNDTMLANNLVLQRTNLSTVQHHRQEKLRKTQITNAIAPAGGVRLAPATKPAFDHARLMTTTESLSWKQIDEKLAWPSSLGTDGKFGIYGGKFVPETLIASLSKLDLEFNRALHDPNFQVSPCFFFFFG